jgi:predicted Zn-dependent protease
MYMMFIRLIAATFFFQLLSECPLQAQSPPTIKEYKKAFTTYPFSDPDPIPSFTKIYPYYRYDGFTTKSIQKEWKVVELENDFIKVMILPEVGGKIWTAIEKSTGQPFIYYNHVVKFRDVAMRGPWTSGGLEANYGIIGHTPNCATPVDYTTKKNADGSVSCIIGVLDLLTRTRWQIDINLPHDKAYFTTGSVWHNPTSLEQPYYHWMNTGIKAKGNLEFVYPGTHYIGHEGEFDDWPVNKKNNKKISFYEQNDFGGYKSYHVFGKYTDFFGGYWHDDQFGMARYAPQDNKAGKKIWIWGLSGQGMIWEKLLTDSDGQYVEVQSGRLFNQNAERSTFTPFKHHSFAPYATDTWKEYWYPVLKTNGFVTANEYGALNIRNENGWLKIYFSPVQKINAKLEIKESEKIIYSKTLELNPLKTFTDSVKINVDQNKLTINVGEYFSWSADPSSGVLSRPVDAPKDFEWSSVYGLYLQGKEFMDQKLYVEAEEKLQDALLKDHNYLPALVKMAELKFRNHQLKESFELAKRALSIDTHDGGANYFYGLAAMQLGDMDNAKDGFTLATLSTPFRSAAYVELSRLYLKEKDYKKSLEYATKAIDFNRYNIAACQLKAICLRYLNDPTGAGNMLDIIASIEPLNAFLKIEQQFGNKAPKQPISNLFQNEQPHQSYLELAIFYIENGLLDEGQRLLLESPGSPLAYYWLAWLQNKKGEAYTQSLEKANHLSPLLVFPFRSETMEVLEWASGKSTSWKPGYYLALILKEKNRVEDCRRIFTQLGNTPDFAPFYAARASLAEKDSAPAELDLKKAIELEQDQWRYHKLLTNHYLALNKNEEALSVAGSYYKTHPQNYVMGMLYAKTLLLNKRYRECDQLLSTLTIIPFEGATEGRELYREAKLSLALNEMKSKKYKKALQLISQSKLFPENLGVGKPYDEDIDVRLEEWMSYLCYQEMKKKVEAEKALQKIIQFRPQIDNTVSNFLPANHLVTAWAMKVKGQEKEAVDWLNQQIKKYPENKIILWSREIFTDRKSTITNESDATTRLLLQLIDYEQMRKS